MSKTVLVAGCDGYIGHALTLKLLKEGHKVIGLDDGSRRQAVNEMGSISAIPILRLRDKIDTFKQLGDFTYWDIGTTNSIMLNILFRDHKVDAIVNLAQQPSAPYSHKSRHHTLKTINKNTEGVINLLYMMREYCPEAHLVHIGTMGEYDPSVGVKIPEGFFKFWYKGRRSQESLFPRRPGSFYHASKVAATYYIDLACRAWGLRATDIMQGIVYGNWTPEIDDTGLHTRLDSDEAFGTILNRFIVQAWLDEPLTIYGNGLHKRGFLSLYDSVQCLMIAINNPAETGEYRTWNQLMEVKSMNEIADTVRRAALYHGIKTQYAYIESPRVENTSKHYYNPVVKKLIELGYVNDGTSMIDEIWFAFDNFAENTWSEEQVEILRKVVMPKIKWR